MPGMDGVETTRELRKKGERFERMAVIALTANAVNGMKEFLLANGMNGFLSKPIRTKELREIMLHWLGREEAAQRAAEKDQEAIPSAWMDIADLDISEGLDNAGRQTDVYVRSLHLLHETIPGFIEKALELSAVDDLRELAIHIHGMKGSLAGVGATNLAERFCAWERAFYAGQRGSCRDDLPGLLDVLDAFGKALGAAAPDRSDECRQKGSYDLGKALETLRGALSTYDYEAVVASAECLKRASIHPDERPGLMKLLLLIDQFDYDGALAWLHGGKVNVRS